MSIPFFSSRENKIVTTKSIDFTCFFKIVTNCNQIVTTKRYLKPLILLNKKNCNQCNHLDPPTKKNKNILPPFF